MNLIFLMQASKVYMNPFGVHSLCMQPNIVSQKQMKFISYIHGGILSGMKCEVTMRG